MPAKKILVTGGAGYIGSHTVVELIEAGYEPIIVDNLSNSNINILAQIEKITGKRPIFYQLELCNPQACNDLLAAHQNISGVIHFAALKAVGESVAQPLRYYRNNLYSLINLLEACSTKAIHFVFSSSCTVYGQPANLPVREDSPTQKAVSPYGNTKQIAEEILQEAAQINPNLHCISLRYFNPVGAHASALIGELPLGVPQNLVPFITQSAIGKRAAITIYGNDYNTPDGTCIRDYIHVVDLAKAHVSALESLEQRKSMQRYHTYNIGTGQGHSVLEVIQAFEEATGTHLNYQIGPRRQGDIEQIYGEVSKAEKELNWKALHSLQAMMKSAWEWENYINQHPFSLS